MTFQEADLKRLEDNKRKIDIGRLTTYPEYYALKEEIEKAVARLKDIENIEFNDGASIEVQVQGAKLAIKTFTSLLADLKAYAYKEPSKGNGYN